MKVVNRGKKVVAFRDDAGKVVLKPRQSHEVRGDQHLVHILTLPGIGEATDRSKGGKVKRASAVQVGKPGPEQLVAEVDSTIVPNEDVGR